jgi:hypothetical protein
LKRDGCQTDNGEAKIEQEARTGDLATRIGTGTSSVGSQDGPLPRAEIKRTTPAARRHQGEEYRVKPEAGELGGKTKMGNGSTGSKHENEQGRAGPC